MILCGAVGSPPWSWEGMSQSTWVENPEVPGVLALFAPIVARVSPSQELALSS
jgi:hypothetical protein